MHFTKVIFTLALAQAILAAPIKRQLAGEGSACNSVFTSTDNGVGYGVENAEDNTANAAPAARRQLHGEGEACDSVLTQTDNGVGYGTENAEDNVAQNIGDLTGNHPSSGGGGTSTGGSPPPPQGGNPPPAKGGNPPPPPPAKGKGGKRQLDKVANGFGEIGQAAGISSSTSGLVTSLDNVDGELTSGASNAGASAGSTEETTLENLGSAVKRQADKIAAGAAKIGQKEGLDKVTGPVAGSLESLDGTLTDGAANLGAGVADAEESTLVGTGSAVPVIF